MNVTDTMHTLLDSSLKSLEVTIWSGQCQHNISFQTVDRMIKWHVIILSYLEQIRLPARQLKTTPIMSGYHPYLVSLPSTFPAMSLQREICIMFNVTVHLIWSPEAMTSRKTSDYCCYYVDMYIRDSILYFIMKTTPPMIAHYLLDVFCFIWINRPLVAHSFTFNKDFSWSSIVLFLWLLQIKD